MYYEAIQNALRGYLNSDNRDCSVDTAPSPVNEGEIPQPLKNAMAYSLLLPGKRIRPMMLLAAYHMLKDDWQEVLPFACALQMIHTYSLIHDDLPAMDNDDYRRGQLTNHKVFGDGIAVLAGDGLLNMAYETMLSCKFSQKNPALAIKAAGEIAKRAGVTGMIAGQTLDVKLEGTTPTVENVEYIHLHKTGDLLTAPITAGLMLAGADEDQIEAGKEFGRNLGMAFQIQDDLLDIEGNSELMGKQTGMDAERGKNTWPAVYGIEKSKKDVKQCIESAVSALECFGAKKEFLVNFSMGLLERKF